MAVLLVSDSDSFAAARRLVFFAALLVAFGAMASTLRRRSALLYELGKAPPCGDSTYTDAKKGPTTYTHEPYIYMVLTD